MTMTLDGEDHEITLAVWEVFERWYGDKAYRQAGMVAELEAEVRRQVADEFAARERSVDMTVGAIVAPGGDWTPIGHGMEARTVLSDRLGTFRVRYVGEGCRG
ncbi:hypothetical protein [Streptomyces sp. NBC_00239]|uniref:hypothetical protein n=1 Tax=Streptomyces sp. NBC_00239 TaxID=2903640 RepID=UPI002E2DCCFF|nr:hypothetical protein [Streptomyces sp. NBC_00239]